MSQICIHGWKFLAPSVENSENCSLVSHFATTLQSGVAKDCGSLWGALVIPTPLATNQVVENIGYRQWSVIGQKLARWSHLAALTNLIIFGSF